ncbi:lipoyl domain-containing protein [Bradyrhizobium diazoefficiens]|nr:lipoyl domain-containing protein [Bradyrhizobium diazoefficiens]
MNMSEATIVEWSKKAGESFAAGDVLYSFETEKVAQDFEATAGGTVIEILVPAGNVAQVGQELCVVDVETAK